MTEVKEPVKKKIVRKKKVEPGKKWYLSKTLWTNFLMGVIAIAIPKVGEILSPEVLAGVFMVVNMLLRMVTKDNLQLK